MTGRVYSTIVGWALIVAASAVVADRSADSDNDAVAGLGRMVQTPADHTQARCRWKETELEEHKRFLRHYFIQRSRLASLVGTHLIACQLEG